jgi:putative endonuclease
VHHVYIARCADGTLYTGYARDLELRERLHNLGRGARYTSGRRPVAIIYSESFALVGDALRREHAIKRLSRDRKLELVASVRLPTDDVPCGSTRR